MKPNIKIGQVVYIVDTIGWYIAREKVGFIGKHSFVIESFDFKDQHTQCWYEDFNKEWFFTFDEARKVLRKAFTETNWDRPEKCRLKKMGDDYWQID